MRYYQSIYYIANSLLGKWIAQTNNSGSIKEKDNRSTEDAELIRLRKSKQQLKMENYKFQEAPIITKLKQSKTNLN